MAECHAQGPEVAADVDEAAEAVGQGTAAVEAPRARDRGEALVSGEVRLDARQPLRPRTGVRVHPHEHVAGGRIEAAGGRRRDAAPRLVHDVRAPNRSDGGAVIRAAVVDHDHLVRGPGL